MAENPPDLQAVLRTLASIAAAQAPSQVSTPAHSTFQALASVQDAQASIEAATALPDSSRAQEAAVPGPATAPAPTVDPTTITEWPPALRWVAKHAAQDAAFIPALKKLWKAHEKHLQEWYVSLLDL